MNAQHVHRIVSHIRTWDEPDRRWWRELLDVAPREALMIGVLAANTKGRPDSAIVMPNFYPGEE